MKYILTLVFILSANLAVADGVDLPSATYCDMGYRVVNSKIIDLTLNKAFPLRKALQKGNFVYTVATDVYMYYNTELDHVLNDLRKSVE